MARAEKIITPGSSERPSTRGPALARTASELAAKVAASNASERIWVDGHGSDHAADLRRCTSAHLTGRPLAALFKPRTASSCRGVRRHLAPIVPIGEGAAEDAPALQVGRPRARRRNTRSWCSSCLTEAGTVCRAVRAAGVTLAEVESPRFAAHLSYPLEAEWTVSSRLQRRSSVSAFSASIAPIRSTAMR